MVTFNHLSWSRFGLIPKTFKFYLVHVFWLLQYVLHGLPGKVRDQDVLQMDEKCQNPRGSGTFTDQPQCDQGFQTTKLHEPRLVPPGPDGDVILENKPKVKEHKTRQTPTPSSYQRCPQKWTSSSNQRLQNEDQNAEELSNQPKTPSETSRTKDNPNDTSPSQSLKSDLNEDRFKDGSASEHLHVNNHTEGPSSGRGDHDDSSPSVLVQTFTDRIILEELLRRFLQHENFADEISQTFPEVSEALHWGVSGLEEPQGGRFSEPLQLDGAAEDEPTPETWDRSERPPPDTSMESTNEGGKDPSPQNDREHPKGSTEPTRRAGSDVQRPERRQNTNTEHGEDFVVLDFYCAERVQTRSSDLRRKTTVQQREDVDQRRSPAGNPKASTDRQRSKVRGGEMKAMAVPDWSGGDGTAEDQRVDESTGPSALTDSCEEADEEAATPQHHQPAPEGGAENVLLRTRDKPRGNCRIS